MKTIAAFLFVIVAATQLSAQSLFDDRQRVEAWLKENNVPAAGIGIIRDGKVREVKVFGELKKGSPAPYDTIFNDASRFARWHDKDGNNSYTDDRTTEVNAADDLLTTVADYARFGVAVMNGDGLSKAVYDEMLKPQAAMKQGAQMTLGWELQQNLNDAGEFALIHSGSDDGVQALVMLLPKSKQGLVVMTNGDNGWKLYEKIVTESLDVGAAVMKRSQ